MPVFQPQLDLRSGRCDRLEVLLRRRDPDGSLAPPALFLDALRRSRRLAAVCNGVYGAAMRQARAWQTNGALVARIAVNLDACQVRDRGWVGALVALVRASGLTPGQIEVEVSERILENVAPPRLAAELAVLRAEGATVALDDFGVGYACLTQLAALPLDVVKLDGALVRQAATAPRVRTIVGATVAMVRSIGLATVLEGIETADQLELARAVGADFAQGYFLGRPLPAADVEPMLSRRPALDRVA